MDFELTRISTSKDDKFFNSPELTLLYCFNNSSISCSENTATSVVTWTKLWTIFGTQLDVTSRQALTASLMKMGANFPCNTSLINTGIGSKSNSLSSRRFLTKDLEAEIYKMIQLKTPSNFSFKKSIILKLFPDHCALIKMGKKNHNYKEKRELQ